MSKKPIVVSPMSSPESMKEGIGGKDSFNMSSGGNPMIQILNNHHMQSNGHNELLESNNHTMTMEPQSNNQTFIQTQTHQQTQQSLQQI